MSLLSVTSTALSCDSSCSRRALDEAPDRLARARILPHVVTILLAQHAVDAASDAADELEAGAIDYQSPRLAAAAASARGLCSSNAPITRPRWRRCVWGSAGGLSSTIRSTQAGESVTVLVAELRRQHPRWGAKRIRLELLKNPPDRLTVPSTSTLNRLLVRQGLVVQRKRKRPRESFTRWQRPGPMQLWQLDIVGGVMLVDPVTGAVREAKVVTGVDDYSRFCVIAAVVERATGRAVCLAFAAALAKFGVPEEVLTDNGKQFTDRFGKGGEVLFDKICRHNGITHRLTQPASPTTTGKIERFHLTLRRELLDDHDLFTSVEAAQAAIDEFVAQYNRDRPHQALDPKRPVTPADRFTAVPPAQREVLPVWLPPTLTAALAVSADPVSDSLDDGNDEGARWESSRLIAARPPLQSNGSGASRQRGS